MNIAAVMAMLGVDDPDLDHMAKMAALVIRCRANQFTGEAPVSAGRVAGDLGVSLLTARRALHRARAAGYLTVDNRPGRVNIWRVPLSEMTGVPLSQVIGGGIADDGGPLSEMTPEGFFRIYRRNGAGASLAHTASAGAGDNPAAVRPHSPDCPGGCGGSGWLLDDEDLAHPCRGDS